MRTAFPVREIFWPGYKHFIIVLQVVCVLSYIIAAKTNAVEL